MLAARKERARLLWRFSSDSRLASATGSPTAAQSGSSTEGWQIPATAASESNPVALSEAVLAQREAFSMAPGAGAATG